MLYVYEVQRQSRQILSDAPRKHRLKPACHCRYGEVYEEEIFSLDLRKEKL